jgi:chemotaxis protein CheX
MIEQKTYHETVLEAAKEVFETMIFMEIEPCDEASITRDTDSLMGSITFKGDLEGCMVISLSWPCGRIITRNMLALEPEAAVAEGDVCDAIGEVANMVMGSIKSRIQDIYPDIEVSIPSVITGKELTGTVIEGTEKTRVPVCIDEEHSAIFSFLYRQKEQ